MSGSAKAGTLAERHRCDTVSSKDTGVRALPSAQGEVRVPLDKDLLGSRHVGHLTHFREMRDIRQVDLALPN